MSLSFNFGHLSAGPRPVDSASNRFRIAVLGDFSARAQAGILERGAALAQRKPIKVDCDNFDKVLHRLSPKLKLEIAGSPVELEFRSLDDFHPDQLYDNLELFSELAGLRQRLKTTSGFTKAAAELQQWTGEAALPNPIPSARGAVVAAADELSDFASLLGQPSTGATEETPLEDLLRKIVGPYVVAAADPRQEAMVASVDEALSATMRSVLHHPDFQALESLWRSVDLLVRRLETGAKLEVVLIDLSAEELAAELSGSQDLSSSGLYSWLVEQPALDEHQGAFSVLVAHYTFTRTKAQAELLGRFAKLGSAIPAAVVTGLLPVVFDEKPEDLAPEVSQAWKALGALPEAGYLALLTPSFLLRQPYGRRSDAVDCFAFEEVKDARDPGSFLWGNPAVLGGLLLGESALESGMKMTPGSHLSVGDLPFYYFTDKDGDQEALPCTERLVTSSDATLATSQGFVPVVGLKGRPEVRLGGFRSLAGSVLAGPWAPARAQTAPTATAQAGAAEAVSATASGDPELDALLAGLDAPAEEPAPAGGSGDPELDALLAGLDAPAEESAPAVAQAPAGDPELDALLAGLDAPAEETAPPAEAPAEDAASDSELNALLAGLDAPAEENATAADPELDSLLSGLDAPAESAPAAGAPAEDTQDPEVAALLAGLDTPSEEAPSNLVPVAEVSDTDAEAPEDPDLAALLSGLDAPEAAIASLEAADATDSGETDPELAALLSGLDAPAETQAGTPEAPLDGSSASLVESLDSGAAELPANSTPPSSTPGALEVAPTAAADEDDDGSAPDSTGDPDLDALLADLAPGAPPAAPAAPGELDPAIAALLEGL